MLQQKENINSTWTNVGDWRMHARVALDQAPADAPAVVLVHGIGLSSLYLIPTLAQLGRYYRVYAPDLPGFGKSTKPQHVLNLQELADALVAWMDAVGLDQPVLLGNSVGCQIIVDLAVRHPQRLTGAVLQGPTVDPRARSASRQLARLLWDGQYEPVSHGFNLIVDYWRCGSRRFLRTFQYALLDPIEEKLPQVQVPTLVVRGTNDPIVQQRWAEEATDLLPNGRLVVIPGASHTIVYATPLELMRVVRPFVDELHTRRVHDESA
jgi:2-hydroxy-6-oxonona-2,4-dienedioate hydrolase